MKISCLFTIQLFASGTNPHKYGFVEIESIHTQACVMSQSSSSHRPHGRERPRYSYKADWKSAHRLRRESVDFVGIAQTPALPAPASTDGMPQTQVSLSKGSRRASPISTTQLLTVSS